MRLKCGIDSRTAETEYCNVIIYMTVSRETQATRKCVDSMTSSVFLFIHYSYEDTRSINVQATRDKHISTTFDQKHLVVLKTCFRFDYGRSENYLFCCTIQAKQMSAKFIEFFSCSSVHFAIHGLSSVAWSQYFFVISFIHNDYYEQPQSVQDLLPIVKNISDNVNKTDLCTWNKWRICTMNPTAIIFCTFRATCNWMIK